MIAVPVDLKEYGYQILIGQKILADLGKILHDLQLGVDAVVITNPVVRKLHGQTVAASLKEAGFSCKFFEVPDGEESKSYENVFKLISQIAQYDVGKSLFVVGLGGGVTGDLAGFVAAIYKRGIPFVQIPTTLLAQVDSAIGGKVGIDLPAGKNLVGAFYQPRVVLSDFSLLSTLPQRQILNGLAEVVKYAVICDKVFFDFLEKNVTGLLSLQPKVFTEVIVTCSRIKAKVVRQDERETKGVRTILNFGHTVGHAIEAANQYKDYQHGEAVALGMRAAMALSVRLGLLKEPGALKVNRLLTFLGLPERIEHVSLPVVMSRMLHDKKFLGKKNRFVLATGVGAVKVVEGVDTALIEQAISGLMQK